MRVTRWCYDRYTVVLRVLHLRVTVSFSKHLCIGLLIFDIKRALSSIRTVYLPVCSLDIVLFCIF